MDRKIILLLFLTAPLWGAEADLAIKAYPPKQGMIAESSVHASMSAEGRWIAFESTEKLVQEDTDTYTDIYIYDRIAQIFERVPRIDPLRLNAGPNLSSDGQMVALHSVRMENLRKKLSRVSNIVLFDRNKNNLELISDNGFEEKEGESLYPRFVAQDNFLVFTSNISSLSSYKTDGIRQIYLYDRETCRPLLISISTNGKAANRTCLDARVDREGHIVVFRSAATNLISGIPMESLSTHLYYLNRYTQFIYQIDQAHFGFDTENSLVGAFDMDESASKIIFEVRPRDRQKPYDTVFTSTLFQFDVSSQTMTPLELGDYKNRAKSPSLDRNGRYVVFALLPHRNKYDEVGGVVVMDLKTGALKKITEGSCLAPLISATGHVITYEKVEDKKISTKRKKRIKNLYVVENPLWVEPAP